MDRHLNLAHEAIAPDGSHIAVLDRWVGTYPEGAMLATVLTAPSVELAKVAVDTLINHIPAADNGRRAREHPARGG